MHRDLSLLFPPPARPAPERVCIASLANLGLRASICDLVAFVATPTDFFLWHTPTISSETST
jgi:hypothetical protein